MQLPPFCDQSTEQYSYPVGVADLVYDLRRKDGCSNCFYADVARFSDILLTEIEHRAGVTIDGYSKYVQTELHEQARSRGEYAIELLVLGMALRRYGSAALHTPRLIVDAARGLFWLRRMIPGAKRLADFLRTMFTRASLMRNIGRDIRSDSCPLPQLPALIRWLQATGEFRQEVARLENWQGFLRKLPQEAAVRCMQASLELFEWFQPEAAAEFGLYTGGVPRFLAGEYCRRGWREDQLLCAKQPVEYHLNMVAVEILNRGLREDFARKSRRVVLVPGCMRGARADKCLAHVKHTDITCAGCDPTCNVNRITQRMRREGVEVFVVPHATGFSSWLKRWQREPDCGVTAVACLLNILPGGFEMRSRGISSQCVVLDYPGCQKHWHREGIATALHENRLAEVAVAT
ncbi:MAG: DUF116 domain-containing protein [Candidatus Acidiferrum sp.]